MLVKRYLKDYKDGEMMKDEVLLLSKAEIKQKKNGEDYLRLTFCDNTRTATANRWTVPELPEGKSFKDYTGKLYAVSGKFEAAFGGQISEIKFRLLSEEELEGVDKRDFIKFPPEDTDDMYDFIVGRIKDFKNEDLRKICLAFYEEYRDKIMYWPAAKYNHHAIYGGLLYHKKRMMMVGERLCEVYTNVDKELLLAGIALHDIQKINEIDSDIFGTSPDYSCEGKLIGHIVMGVSAVEKKADELGIDNEIKLCLMHMILSHHGEPEFGSLIRPKFPEAELLSKIDLIDARMYDMEEALADVKPGEFGPKVFTLDNVEVYKKNIRSDEEGTKA